MQSTNLRQIKEALWKQAFLGGMRVCCPVGQVVAIRKRKMQLLAMIRGWGLSYLVEHVTIEVMFTWPYSHERVKRGRINREHTREGGELSYRKQG